MEDSRRTDILVRYKERSIELVSRHMNDIAKTLADILVEDLPFEVPREHRKKVNKLRGDLATGMWSTNPERNTKLRNLYKTISKSALILIDGPYDETGTDDLELLTRWSAYAHQISECGFDIGGRIIIIDEILHELTDPNLTINFAVNHLMLRQGIIGSMYTIEPKFTPNWEAGYIIWSFMTAAIDVIDNIPEMRYSGGN